MTAFDEKGNLWPELGDDEAGKAERLRRLQLGDAGYLGRVAQSGEPSAQADDSEGQGGGFPSSTYNQMRHLGHAIEFVTLEELQERVSRTEEDK